MSRAAPSPAGEFSPVSVKADHICGVATGGGVLCWSYDEYGQATPLGGSRGRQGNRLKIGFFYPVLWQVRDRRPGAGWDFVTFGLDAPRAGESHTFVVRTDGPVAC